MNKKELLPVSFHLGLKWLLAVVVLAALLLAGTETGVETDWECTPVDPYMEALPDNPCFRATLSAENRVTLEWRVVNAQRFVYIYDDVGRHYDDVGLKAAVCRSLCSTSFRLSEGGIYRWKLMVNNETNSHRIHVPVSILIDSPRAPVELSGGGMVDMLAPMSRTFSWTVNPDIQWAEQDLDKAWIEVREPGFFLWNATHYPRSGPNANFTVSLSALSEPGDFVYGVRDCHLPPDSAVKFCSKEKNVAFHVGYDHFIGPNTVHVRSGVDLDISFTTESGNVRLLSSQTLVPRQNGLPIIGTVRSEYTIDGALLTPGIHEINLTSCRWPTMICANRADAERAGKDGVIHERLPGYHAEGDLIATILPDDGAPPQVILAPATGVVHFESTASDDRVNAGELVAFSITGNNDTLEVVVDSSVTWTTARHYTEDFDSGVGYSVLGAGGALDISYDSEGGIWLLNEFSNSIEHVTPLGVVESLELPLSRNPSSTPTPFAPVRPFAFWFAKSKAVPATFSLLAERVQQVGSLMWFTQGGGMSFDSAKRMRNHSRIISFDSSLTDSPATVYDDRMCIYSVPTDDAQGFGNNQVIGLAGIGERIWIGESRGFLNGEVSLVSSFIPDRGQCANLLNYEDPDALANQSLQYCESGMTPEQDGCMARLPLYEFPGGVKVAHLEADLADGLIWFTDMSGKHLGKIDLTRPNAVEVYNLPNTHEDPFDGMVGFGGFPWSLQVDAGGVYIGEYATRHILRFDKETKTFSEIHVPYANSQVRLHSLAIDSMTDRLWFSLANEPLAPADMTASTIGYIDLASWRAVVANPQTLTSIQAVLYAGLENIPASELYPDGHQSFRGIAIDPASGKVAIATMRREQITELTPKLGFWP